MSEEKKITIRVGEKTRDKLKIMSVKQKMPVNEICARLLSMYLKSPSMINEEVNK